MSCVDDLEKSHEVNAALYAFIAALRESGACPQCALSFALGQSMAIIGTAAELSVEDLHGIAKDVLDCMERVPYRQN